MTHADLRYRIDPKTGAWYQVPASDDRLPYITMEQRPLEEGETYEERTAAGHSTGKHAAFPEGRTHQLVAVWHMADGQTVDCPHFGPDGIPLERHPDVDA